MTDVYTPPANSTLSSASAPIAVVADNDVVSLSVSFGASRVTETVWQQGVFCYPYLRSTRADARTFTIARDSEWPANPRFWVNDPTATTPAQLQPLTSLSGVHAKAAWTLMRDGSGNITLTDRTGNGWDLAAGNKAWVPDLIPGKAAYNPYSGFAGGLFSPVAGPILLGAASITARVVRSEPSAGADSWLYAAGNYNTHDTSFSFLTCSALHDCLAFYVRNSGVDSVYYSALQLPSDGQWHFVSCARAASGYITVGVDGVYETSATPFAAQVTGAGSVVSALGHAGVSTRHLGPAADLVLWDGWLPNADVDALSVPAMGS